MTRDQNKQPASGQPRRSFLQQVGSAVPAAALMSLLRNDLLADETGSRSRGVYDIKPQDPHHTPRAKSIIHLFMNGGPSQMDLFDPKPELTKRHGQSLFEEIAGEVESPADAGALMKSPFRFSQHGQSGMWVSELLPYTAQCVDDITLIRSMQTVNLTHEPSIWHIQSGRMLPGLPSMGAWVTYGLGTENQNLPAYVVLDDPGGLPINGTQNWQSGFLPPVYQGTRFRSTGSPVLNLKRDYEQPDAVAAIQTDLIAELDQLHRDRRAGQPRLDARIASYELAARMQISASDALDLSQESAETQAMYGIGNGRADSYGRRCLMARRLVERGVRFVQLYIQGQIWDHHTKIRASIPSACEQTDQPIAGLLKDLKQRGLLEDTLVVWGGEFGRLPIAQIPNGQEKNAGRDHNKQAMCTWMAGGGVKAGITYGATDELGFSAVENRITVNDWQATILHLLGLDHERLSFHRNGLNEKLTGVAECHVVHDILA